ncbi:MAG: hypothetical protein COA41_11265 [Sphingopyxis sp.]|nr:MAG: hypothetical protein COA41_11265 [Sphingopyxis sp.]
MRLIGARQAWHDAYHENRDSVMAYAAEQAKLGKRMGGGVVNRKILLEDEEGNVTMKVCPTRVDAVQETRPGRLSTDGRCAHMLAAGLVMQAIETLPKPIQHFGHFLYSPLANGNDLSIAHSLVWFGSGIEGSLSERKRHQAYWMVVCALQSYKGAVLGRSEMSRVAVCAFVEDRLGMRADPSNWARDWASVWETLGSRIDRLDAQALKPVAALIQRVDGREEVA